VVAWISCYYTCALQITRLKGKITAVYVHHGCREKLSPGPGIVKNRQKAGVDFYGIAG